MPLTEMTEGVGARLLRRVIESAPAREAPTV